MPGLVQSPDYSAVSAKPVCIVIWLWVAGRSGKWDAMQACNSVRPWRTERGRRHVSHQPRRLLWVYDDKNPKRNDVISREMADTNHEAPDEAPRGPIIQAVLFSCCR